MEPAQIEVMLGQMGLSSLEEFEDQLVAQTQNTSFAEAAKTKNSVFFTLMFDLLREPYRIFREAVGAMMPQLFISSATGCFLDQFAADYDLSRVMGVKAKYQLLLTPATGQTSLQIPQGECFGVNEAKPRLYFATQEYSFGDTSSDWLIEVEAEKIGEKYNLLSGQISKAYGNVVVANITNNEQKVAGEEIETDEQLRARIFNKKWSQGLAYGVEAKYLSALQSIGSVVHATLDQVDQATARLDFTIYGANGALDANVVAAALAALEGVKMATDSVQVTVATEVPLNLTISLPAGDYPADINEQIEQSIAGFMTQMRKGANFSSSLLINWLYDHLLALDDVPFTVSPLEQILPTSSYFSANITIEIASS